MTMGRFKKVLCYAYIQWLCFIYRYHLRYADFIWAQMMHETGNFNSAIFKDLNNAFGMQMPRKRQTTAIGSENRLEGQTAKYSSVYSSIKDFFLWARYVSFTRYAGTVDEYSKALRAKSYYTDSLQNYTQGLARALPDARINRAIELGFIVLLVPFSLVVYTLLKTFKP